MMLHKAGSESADHQKAESLPASIEAEQQILGALLYRNSLLDVVDEVLSAEQFFEPIHGRIYDVIKMTVAEGKRADPVSLQPAFGGDHITPEMSVGSYLGRLVAMVVGSSPTAAMTYAKLVRDLAIRRQLIAVARDIEDAAAHASNGVEAAALLEDAETAVYSVTQSSAMTSSRLISMVEAVKKATDAANAAHRQQGRVGIRTGLVDLDAKLGGLHPSDLIILAGRPSMGKTALAGNIARYVATSGRTVLADDEFRTVPAPVLFFSLEMSAEQVASRMIAEVSGISSAKIRAGVATSEELETYIRASLEIQELKLHIEETGGIGLAQLSAIARRHQRRHGLALIIIDYLQLMRGSGRKGDNRVQEITEITTGLKALAKDLNVPIITLSQLSRAVETREDKRPQLSDLRESGSIEQDADVVMFVFREEYYVERQKPDDSDMMKMSEWDDRMRRCAGKAEVVIGKQRHGPIGIVELAFDQRLTRFSNLARGV